MRRSILKPVVLGVLFGTLTFLMPFFLLKVMFFFLIMGALFRLFGRRRFGPGGPGAYRLAFADHIRNMNEEEYSGSLSSHGVSFDILMTFSDPTWIQLPRNWRN